MWGTGWPTLGKEHGNVPATAQIRQPLVADFAAGAERKVELSVSSAPFSFFPDTSSGKALLRSNVAGDRWLGADHMGDSGLHNSEVSADQSKPPTPGYQTTPHSRSR